MDTPLSATGPDPARAGTPRRVGLIAGGGRFPFIIAESLRRQGIEVVCVGVRYHAPPELAALCQHFSYVGLCRLGRIIRVFKKHDVKEIAWAGWLRKEELFRPWRFFSLMPDWRAFRLYFFGVPDRQNQTLLGALANEFVSEGIEVAHSTKFCPELLADEGVYTRKQPTKAQEEDISFGWKVCKRMADIDVGQSVVVHEKSTIAVEAIEGTDRNIRRAGEYAKRGGFVVVKLAKDGHDMRYDVPAVGPDTIDAIHEAGGSVLALEAKKTILLDREIMVEKANRHGIVIVAYSEPPSGSGASGDG
jgi:DUF1009 family protein